MSRTMEKEPGYKEPGLGLWITILNRGGQVSVGNRDFENSLVLKIATLNSRLDLPSQLENQNILQISVINVEN